MSGSKAKEIIQNLLASADISIDGSRPCDIQVHEPRFYARVLAGGSLVSERTKEGLKRARAEGKLLGRPKGTTSSKLDGKEQEIRDYLGKGVNVANVARIYGVLVDHETLCCKPWAWCCCPVTVTVKIVQSLPQWAVNLPHWTPHFSEVHRQPTAMTGLPMRGSRMSGVVAWVVWKVVWSSGLADSMYIIRWPVDGRWQTWEAVAARGAGRSVTISYTTSHFCVRNEKAMVPSGIRLIY